MDATRESRRKKLFHLQKIGTSHKEVIKFWDELLYGLGEELFRIELMQDLIYLILKQVNPICRTVQNNPVSIEYASEKIIKYLKFDRIATLKNLSTGEVISSSNSEKSYTQKFCEQLLRLEKPPGRIYESLKDQVGQDLNQINGLIKWYESLPLVQIYINTDKISGTEGRIHVDFYKRCLKEQSEILEFFLSGIKERAISKARYLPAGFRAVFAFSEAFYDRPYYFGRPFSIHYFDSRQIDEAGHRIGEFPFDESINLQKLYFSNKALFYRKYFKKHNPEHHFKQFNSYLLALPLQANRKEIFDELILLFKTRRWISFYALALPQVEGLFSEMCSAISPNKDIGISLSHKVNVVRPYHGLSASYFDYYQYHLPKQRNKFAHEGYAEDYKLKSYDLLVDLTHLLGIFSELDNPLVKVKKLHSNRTWEDFINISAFVTYFKLLKGLSNSQRESLDNELQQFEREFLAQECNLDYSCFQMTTEFPLRINEFLDECNRNIGPEVSLVAVNMKELKALFKESSFKTSLSEQLNYKVDFIEPLVENMYFLEHYRTFLPSINDGVRKMLEEFKAEYKLPLAKVRHIIGELEPIEG